MPQEIVSQFDRKYGLPIETNRSVQNISQRNAIPESVRWEGMIVHVIGDQSYILLDGIDNTAWEPLGGLVDVNVVDDLLSTSPTDALSANQGRVLKDLIDNIDLSDYQLLSEKGSANGYAPLDSGAKVPIANLPDSLVGQVIYQGIWAASTNTPTLSNPPDSSTKGHYYVCSDSGTQFGISFQTGDWIISNGSAWEKVDNTDAVTSVFGRLGNVVANSGDYAAYYLGISAKAADSELLDGINSTQFLRSDVSDEKTSGNLILSNTVALTARTSGGVETSVAVINAGNVLIFGSESIDTRLYGSSLSPIYRTGGTNYIIWHSGNDGPSSGLNADLLDDVQGSSFLRSDTADIMTAGSITFNDNIQIRFGTSGGESSMYSNGNHTFLDMTNGGFFIRDGTTQRYVFNDNGNMVATGSVTAASFETTNWQIVETAGVLQFKYGGVTKFEMNSTGIMEASDTFKQGL